jgi:hypothetical protein
MHNVFLSHPGKARSAAGQGIVLNVNRDDKMVV